MAPWLPGGYNDYGQLGNGTTTDSSVPVAVDLTGVLAGKTVTQVSAGGVHTVALCSDGTLAAWGFNGTGQLADGTTTDSSVPVAVDLTGVLAGKTVTQVSAGFYHTVALCSDGTLATWGYNGNGQLGDGTMTYSSVPVAIVGLGSLRGQSVTQIEAGDANTVALSSPATPSIVTYTSPTPNQKIAITAFGPGSLSGTATDNVGVTAVKVRISRKRNNVNAFWNGTDFVADSQTFVDADLTPNPDAKTVTWSLDTHVPPQNKLDGGLYNARVYSIGAVGNRSGNLGIAFTILSPTVDVTKPDVTINTPTNNAVVNINSLFINGTATDNFGVANVKIKLQRKRGTVTQYWNGTAFTLTVALFDANSAGLGSTSVTWQLPATIPASALDKGGYTVYATAYDAAGNAKTSASRLFTIAGTPAPVNAPATAKSAPNS